MIKAPANLLGLRTFRLFATQVNIAAETREYKDVPGPSKFQLIRRVLPGGKYHKKCLKDMLLLIKEEYGDLSILPKTFGNEDMLICSNPDDFNTIFRSEGVWPERRGLASLGYFREHYGGDLYKNSKGLLNSQGEDWSLFRSKVNPVFMNANNSKLYFPKLLNASSDFVERIKEVRNSDTLEVPKDFIDDIKRWTFENVLSVGLDRELGLIRKNRNNPEALKVFKCLDRFFQLSLELDVKPPFWKIYPTANFKEMMHILEEMQTTFQKYIDEAEASMDHTKTFEDQSILQRLVNIDKTVAVVMVMDMLLAGVDTTSSVFTGVLLSIATNPEQQEILRKEILELFPNKDSELHVDKIKNMPYLRACIKESIRMYALGFGVIRTTGQDVVVSGYKVPKGVHILVNTENLMVDEVHFSKAKEFVPERWLRTKLSEGECPIATKSANPFIYTPFGFGPRSCIGKRLVDMELEIGLISLLRNFKIEYNYPKEKVFTPMLINNPTGPLSFKFIDL